MRSYVGEGNVSVVDYLLEVFGRDNLCFCGLRGCRFVCPKTNLPFEVFEPIEYLTFVRDKKILEPGIYRISRHDQGDTYHFLRLQKYTNRDWVDFASFNGGWVGNVMLDWRGIRSIQEKLSD
jgi:hypothetical protein